MPRYRLGVLDQSPICEGRTAADAVAETLELAVAAERLGYERYWVAEHHASESFAGTCPPILMARLAAATSSIRIGSGGVMLMHYSALAVAEQFRMLEILYPGRIDLGVGRAPGADPLGAVALSATDTEPDLEQRLFETKLVDLGDWLRDSIDPGHPHAGLLAMPRPARPEAAMPELWLLGSGSKSAALAAEHGLGFCFAQFLSGSQGVAIVDGYREDFRPSPWLSQPRVAVAVFVLVAETDAEAERLVSSTELWFLELRRGRRIPFPTPERALAFEWSPEALALRHALRSLRIHGGPERVARKLERLSQLYATDELLVVTITHDHAARLRSYELLASLAR